MTQPIYSTPRQPNRGSIGWTTVIVGPEDSLPAIARDVWRLVPTEVTLEFSDWRELFAAARSGLRPDLLIVDSRVDPTVSSLALDAIGAGRYPALSETMVVCFSNDESSKLWVCCDIACDGSTPEDRAEGIRRAVVHLQR